MYQDGDATLGQVIGPVDAVGVYVPGGKAVYPSSVLMCAIPAKVAGVSPIVMVTPPQKEGINPYLLVAADIAGVTEIYRVGGVQAVAALAYGTKTIAKVDKIVGPGNIYVATAKRLLYGTVGIDMVAGPSELLVVADEEAKRAHVADDLLCEAEHDEEQVFLVTTSERLAKDVSKLIEAIEGILYFDDATFDSILTVYDKQEWTMYDIQKQYFNFEWLDKDVKEELEKTELEKAYMPDYFFTRSELGHCLLMDKKILFFKYSN